MALKAEQFVLEKTSASSISAVNALQTLWSGYGEIVRYTLNGYSQPSVVLKHIRPGTHTSHPRGWDTNQSNQRKIRSYQVESHWYQHYAFTTHRHCRVPSCLGLSLCNDNEILLLLEDLDTQYPRRRESLTVAEATVCLDWLAHFHATFINSSAEGLWPIGTYWHLATRPDEFQAMAAGDIKQAADTIDLKLNQCHFQTLVHGDAKVANFCFDEGMSAVAAVDFQYVGRGCGIRDVAYFLGSCLSGDTIEANEKYLLDHYFSTLTLALSERVSSTDIDNIEQEWRDLYAIAWTDFYRFLLGWNPGHWKIDAYTRRQSLTALSLL